MVKYVKFLPRHVKKRYYCAYLINQFNNEIHEFLNTFKNDVLIYHREFTGYQWVNPPRKVKDILYFKTAKELTFFMLKYGEITQTREIFFNLKNIPEKYNGYTKMVKVISTIPPPSIVKELICRKCGATLEYTPNDIRKKIVTDYTGGSDEYQYIDCPNCNNANRISII